MKRRKETRILSRSLKRLHWPPRRQRLGLFWVAALIGLALPWLPSFSLNTEQLCIVNSVYDGDTMRLTCEGKRMKIRLYCIDAPEMGQRPWGRASRDYLRTISPERVIVVVHGRDRYGRTIGEVFTANEDQENLNLVMVRSGQAVVFPKYCHDRQYYQAEDEAKKLQSGVWEKLGVHQRPWAWRHRH
jgi:endonuclease YncB( thermonuclease family)